MAGAARAVAERPPWLAALPGDAAARLAGFARFAAGERLRAERLPVEVLLERAIAHTGYDLAILARAGGDRRLANLRKLMRLAREYERAEGRDLRGFLAYAVGQDLAEAREGEAALESEGLDAVRLMTIHRAKGLEFPVVCVADLGRPGALGRDRLLIGDDGDAGLRLLDARRRRARAGARLGADRRRAGRGRGGRGAAPALRRRHARRGAADPLRRHRHREVAASRAAARRRSTGSRPRCSAAPGRSRADATVAAAATGRVAVRLLAAERRRDRRARRRASVAASPGTALPAEPKVIPLPARPAARPAPALVLVAAGLRPLRLPLLPRRACSACRASRRRRVAPAAGEPRAPSRAEAVAGEPPPLDKLVRGSLVHALLEELDFARPEPPDDADGVRALGERAGLELARRAGRRRPGAGRGLRRLAAVRAARRGDGRPPRGRLRLRARARTAAARC